MANYFVEYDIPPDTSGGTVTQNVAFGDTITVDFRGDGPEEYNEGLSPPLNCSVSEIGSSPVLSPGGTRFIVSGFVGGTSYFVKFQDDEGDNFDLVGSVSGGAGGSDNYGLEVFGPNGTSTVFSPSHRFSNTSGAVASSLSGQGTTDITVPGASGTSSYVVFVLKDTERRAQITKFSTFYRVKNTASSGTSVITTLGVLIG